ncbi:MAG: MBL fold metallo-hydrolase, partial [Myxococcales bacterium]|nr:MBL fold metallo-hydrolase [Myxococcales bacterium]
MRGSIATPGPKTVRYGGNTPCVEVHAADRMMIFDGGTGLRCLGEELMRRGKRIEADLFLTHMHWDHIQGIPFFTPAFLPGNRFRMYGERKGDQSLRDVLEGQMTHPNFPVPLSVMRSELSFHEVKSGEVIDLGSGVTVRTAAMHHPNDCLGLRVEYAGRSLVYTTDTEHDPESGELDQHVLDLAKDADALIYDSMYTEDEYRNGKIGWGHSTYTEALRIARAAGVRKLFFFHHDPVHDDDFLD